MEFRDSAGSDVQLDSSLSDNAKGVFLALSSSVFIGGSFVVKKNALRKLAGKKARDGGFGYLADTLWWAGMIMMVAGELANFAAYAFAPAIMVTPLGALSIIVSAVLSHSDPDEKLNGMGLLGCGLCIIGSVVIVLHAPAERAIHSVHEVAQLAVQPPFAVYALLASAAALWLFTEGSKQKADMQVYVHLGLCSIMGSFTVISCKAVAIALKLTYSGSNQLVYPETYFFAVVLLVCLPTQVNYLNKALDSSLTAIVSPVYYVMFTVLTIVASITLFQERQSAPQVVTEACGFLTIVAGTTLLRASRQDGLFDLSLQASRSLGREAHRGSTDGEAASLVPARAVESSAAGSDSALVQRGLLGSHRTEPLTPV